jgi:hypothetical protein
VRLVRTTATRAGKATQGRGPGTRPARLGHGRRALVRSGDWIDYGRVLAQPDAFDKALAQRVDELQT